MMAAPQADTARIKRNIQRMIDGGADDDEIDAYIASEGVKVEDLGGKSPNMEPMSPLTSGLMGGIDALTMGAGDELSGLLGPLRGVSREDATQAVRDMQRRAESENPIAYNLGAGFGMAPWAMVNPFQTAMRAGAKLAGRMAGSAADAGLQAGTYNAMSAEGSLGERLQDAAPGGGLAAAIGSVIPLGGKVMGMARRGTQFGANTDPAANAQLAEQMGVPLTKGQLTGDLSQEANEQSMAHVGRGPWAANTMERFNKGQTEALGNVQTGIQSDLAGNQPMISQPADAGDIAVSGVRQRAQQLKDTAQARYREGEDLGAMIDANEVDAAYTFVQRHLNSLDTVVDAVENPQATRVMGWIRDLQKEIANPAMQQTMPLPAGSPPVSAAAMSVRGINRVMRRMNNLKADPTKDDFRVLNEVRRGFYDWMTHAVDNALYSGDPQALTALREANDLWRQYQAIANPKPKPRAVARNAGDAMIARMVADDVTPQEAANWLVGMGNMGNSASWRALGRMKQIFGADSLEFASLRQGAWQNLISRTSGRTPPQAQAQSEAIFEFINGKGKTTARLLYSPDEIQKMLNYAKLLKLTIPDPKATNPSRSSYGIARQYAGRFGMAIGAMLGGAAGSVGGAAGMAGGGFSGAVLGASGGKLFTNIAGLSAARKATQPNIKWIIAEAERLRRGLPVRSERGFNRNFGVINRTITPLATERQQENRSQVHPLAR